MSDELANDVIDLIGGTPLLSFDGILIKCEFMNPSGSIKGRMVKHLIEQAEKNGDIHPGMTLVEATSGNTGNALAMIGGVKGYKVLLCTPAGYTHERYDISYAYGAEIRTVGDFQLNEAVDEAKRLGKLPGHWCLSQFDNEGNIEENYRWLGPEILSQLSAEVTVDAVLQGIGTGGTLIGVGRAFREQHNSRVKLVAVEPEESSTLTNGKVGRHSIEWISDGFIPPIVKRNRSMIDQVITVKSEDAVNMMRELAKKHGLLVGASSAANLLAARKLREQNPEIQTILTFFCDEGEKYLSLFAP
jgi:cysteine synthase A